MQRAQEKSTELVPGANPSRAGLSPVIAFLILAVVIGAIALAVFLTRPTTEVQAASTTTTESTEPNFALTNEEAIARFEELLSRELQAYQTADPTLIDEIFTPDSPVAPDVRKELHHLVRDGVTAEPTYRSKDLSVLENSAAQIQIRQKAEFRAAFYDASGNEITKDSGAQFQTIKWTLRLVGEEWLLHDAVVVASRPIKK